MLQAGFGGEELQLSISVGSRSAQREVAWLFAGIACAFGFSFAFDDHEALLNTFSSFLIWQEGQA